MTSSDLRRDFTPKPQDLVDPDPGSGPGHVQQSLQRSQTGDDLLHLVLRVGGAEEFHADPWRKSGRTLRRHRDADHPSVALQDTSSPSIRCSRSEFMSSGLLAPPTEEVCPIEVGVAGLDRLAGVSSDASKPAETIQVHQSSGQLRRRRSTDRCHGATGRWRAGWEPRLSSNELWPG